MRVKICGVTRIEDADHAAEAGAWAVGLIFWPGSKRRCGMQNAQEIAALLKRRTEVCGVFVNATLDHVAKTVDAVGLTMVQLHGEEGPSYCAEVARRTGAKVVKAARVSTGADVAALRPYSTDFHLLDTHRPGRPGGTGETFDWSLARTPRAAPGERQVPLILSGGLTPENVGEAIRTARPKAVDVAGGTDRHPGTKDPALVEAFIAAARSAWPPPGEAAPPGGAQDPATAPAAAPTGATATPTADPATTPVTP